jgi:hypothetical protein
MSVSEAPRHARGSRWSMVEKQHIVDAASAIATALR